MDQDGAAPPQRRPGRPATGQTPVRTVRIGNVWDRCMTLAQQRGEKMTALVERALIAEEKRLNRQFGSRTSGSATPPTGP